jgi:hypothetical protein
MNAQITKSESCFWVIGPCHCTTGRSLYFENVNSVTLETPAVQPTYVRYHHLETRSTLVLNPREILKSNVTESAQELH